MRLNRLLTAIIILLVFGNTLLAQQYRVKKSELLVYEFTSSGPAWQKYDSTNYYYSNNRGGIYTNEYIRQAAFNRSNYYFLPTIPHLKFDSSVCRTNPNASVLHICKQTFDAKDNIILHAFSTRWPNGLTSTSTALDDTLLYNGYLLTESGKGMNRIRYNYNFRKQVDTTYYMNGNICKVYIYNSSSLLEHIYGFAYYGSPTDTTTYTYNTSGLPVSIITSKWAANTKYGYTYTYNSKGKLTSEIYSNAYGLSTPLTDYSKKEYWYNGKNEPDSAYLMYGGGSSWQNAFRYRYHYNSVMLMDSVLTDKWKDGMWQAYADTITRNVTNYYFTYEPYFPTGISTVQNIQINLTTYPNPATDIIHLNAELPAQAAVTVGIYDAQGKLLRKQDAAPTQQLRLQMVVADLPSGTYILRLDGKDIAGSQQFIISR